MNPNQYENQDIKFKLDFFDVDSIDVLDCFKSPAENTYKKNSKARFYEKQKEKCHYDTSLSTSSYFNSLVNTTTPSTQSVEISIDLDAVYRMKRSKQRSLLVGIFLTTGILHIIVYRQTIEFPFSPSEILKIMGQVDGQQLIERLRAFKNACIRQSWVNYNQVKNQIQGQQLKLEFVCNLFGFSKKSYSDYLTQIKKGIYFKYDYFSSLQGQKKMGNLRQFVKGKKQDQEELNEYQEEDVNISEFMDSLIQMTKFVLQNQ